MILDHTHGVASNRCKHPECVATFARYRKRWKLADARGQRGTVDITRVALHIATLSGLDWSYGAIAGAAGVSQHTITNISSGRQKRVTTRVAAAILSVDPNQTPSRAAGKRLEPMVPALGTRRRLQALQFMDWPASALATHSGRSVSHILSIRDQSGRWVLRSTHDWVASLYRDLSAKRGPSPRAGRSALARGYVGPTAWDDIDHDPEPEDETSKEECA